MPLRRTFNPNHLYALLSCAQWTDGCCSFGGVKDSGIGREGGVQGIEEYLQLKTIVTGNLHSRQSQL